MINIDGFLTGCSKYPPELLNGRIAIEGNVISCIAKDLLLLDEADIDTKDFISEDACYYYSLFKNIRTRGFSSLDEITILSNISEFIEVGFQERGGWSVLQNLIDIINIKNWDTYLDILCRENIIINLYNDGFNLLSPIEESGKKIIPLELFRKMDSESVMDWYESRLSGFGTGYSNKVLEEEEIDIDNEFLERLEEGLENGVPFDIFGEDIDGKEIKCLPFLSRQLNGLMDGTTTVLGGYSSAGKTTAWITVIMGLIYRNRKILIISNEQKAKVFKIQFVVWLLAKRFKYFNLTKKKLMSGDISEQDKVYLKKAQEYWNNEIKGKVKFIAIPDADMTLVKKKIRENVLKHGYDTVLYDTLKLDLNTDNKQYYLELIKDSREFDKMSKKYNIIMLLSLQLAINTLGKLFLDASVLSMSKQIKEVLENLLLMRTVYPEELDPENKKYYCKPFQRKNIAGKWCEEEYIPDQTAVWRMLFVDKARSGENSSDNGIAYLLRFDGAHGTFLEASMCRPKHATII